MKNKKHYDWAGDPIPQLKDALLSEFEKMIPEDRFKNPFKKFRRHDGKWTFASLADDLLRKCPENVTLAVDDAGVISFTREEPKADPLAALASDALSDYTKDPGPADLQELMKRTLDASTFKNLLE